VSAHRRPSAAAAIALLALALEMAGCGDPALWARWQCERTLFRLGSLERRLLARHAPDAEFARLEQGYRALLDRYPPERWAPPGSGPGIGLDVGLAAGRAGLALAGSEARRHMDGAAERDLASLEPRVAALPGVLLGARLARVVSLERLGRFEEAEAERDSIVSMDPLADEGRAASAVLGATLHLVADRRARGDESAAGAALARANAGFAAALARADSGQADALAEALSQVCAERGDAAGALAPLRARLAHVPPGWFADRLRVMAARALQAGAPDSAIVYANRAAALDDSRGVAGPAWLVAAGAFEALGRPDSALARYDQVLSHWNDPGALGPSARYRRAELLERTGQWARAASEYHALSAVYPTNPLAFLSTRQIVQHHLRHDEPELARVEGETGVEILRRLLRSNRDPVVQLHAAAVEGDLLLALGRFGEAEIVMLDLWRRFPEDSTAEAAALGAARLAALRPGGGSRADSVRALLARAASDATVRSEARRESAVTGAR